MTNITEVGQWLLLLLIGWMSMLPAAALSKPSFRWNDISFTSDSSFRVTGRDPYLVFTPLNPMENPRYLILDLQHSEGTASAESLSMELFFHSTTDQPESFDPLYRVKFEIENAALRATQTRLAVPLPATRVPMSRGKMRLDIDQCAGCTFNVGAYPRFAVEPNGEVIEITPIRVFNGLYRLHDLPQNLASLDWHPHDLEPSENGLIITGDDPYLVLPHLDLATAELGGVRFVLTVSDVNTDFVDLQFFYATESHRFTERASTYLRVAPEPGGRIEFVVPLRYLATDEPVQKGVHSFRLDFPSTLPEALWQFNEVSLISAEALDDFNVFVPSKMVQAKLQRARGLRLIENSLTKVFADIGFSISYFLLLLFTTIGFWRAYKK